MSSIEKFIAERKLQFSTKGDSVLKEFSIRISEPFPVDQGTVSFPVGEGCFGCHVIVEGLDEIYPDVYGADSLQAVNLASNVEPFLKRLHKKYDIYCMDGEPYFEHEK